MFGAHHQRHHLGPRGRNAEGAAVIPRREPREDEVEAPFLKSPDKVGRGRDLDRRLDPRRDFLNLADRGDKAAHGGAGDGTDAHLAHKTGADIAHLGLKTVEFRQHGAGMLQEGAARLGRLHPLGMAQEKGCSGLCLDLVQDARGGGLRHGKGGRRHLKLPGLGDLQDQPQMGGFEFSGQGHDGMSYRFRYADHD